MKTKQKSPLYFAKYVLLWLISILILFLALAKLSEGGREWYTDSQGKMRQRIISGNQVIKIPIAPTPATPTYQPCTRASTNKENNTITRITPRSSRELMFQWDVIQTLNKGFPQMSPSYLRFFQQRWGIVHRTEGKAKARLIRPR